MTSNENKQAGLSRAIIKCGFKECGSLENIRSQKHFGSQNKVGSQKNVGFQKLRLTRISAELQDGPSVAI